MNFHLYLSKKVYIDIFVLLRSKTISFNMISPLLKHLHFFAILISPFFPFLLRRIKLFFNFFTVNTYFNLSPGFTIFFSPLRCFLHWTHGSETRDGVTTWEDADRMQASDGFFRKYLLNICYGSGLSVYYLI